MKQAYDLKKFKSEYHRKYITIYLHSLCIHKVQKKNIMQHTKSFDYPSHDLRREKNKSINFKFLINTL